VHLRESTGRELIFYVHIYYICFIRVLDGDRWVMMDEMAAAITGGKDIVSG